MLLAFAVVNIQRPRWLRTFTVAFGGVAANLGGVPLAFAFIAALGVQGLATKVLTTMGVDFVDPAFLGSNAGLTIVYLYFQIPLMLLVVLPAIDGLQASWREAAANLGAGPFAYWRRVGGPILAPSVLGGLLLLFANSFSAYATAYAISTGASRLAPVQIRFYLQGDQSGYAEVGYAIGRVDDRHRPRGDGRLPRSCAAARNVGGDERSAVPRRARGSCVILCVIFFTVPMIALARFSFQKVPVVRLGWSTLFDKWTWDGLARRAARPEVPAGAVLQPAPRARLGAAHAGAAAADRAARPPAPPQGPPVRRGAHADAVRRPADHARRRRARRVPRLGAAGCSAATTSSCRSTR